MLSLAKLHHEDEWRVSTLVAGFVQYLRQLASHLVPQTAKNNTQDKEQQPKDLFPSHMAVKTDMKSSSVPCSTSGNESLVKIENEDGSISWRLQDDSRATSQGFSAITSPFMNTGTMGQTFSTLDAGFVKDSPSPVNMQHPHKRYFDSDMESPHATDLPNPEFFDIAVKQEDSFDEEDSGSDKGKGNKVYNCEYCGAEFRIRGYLTRHVKKHALTKAYECPFYEEHSDSKCHPTGGFSRRDTYKTHLKARHFKYPPGTRSQERASKNGKCGLCNKPYESNEEWVEKHIENGECEGLPEGYTARVKNSRRKNYEYPNPAQISPVSSNTNDSPSTSGSPTGAHQPLAHHQLGHVHDSIKLAGELHRAQMVQQLQLDYDNNDEFSLDVEQTLSFRPMMSQEYYA